MGGASSIGVKLKMGFGKSKKNNKTKALAEKGKGGGSSGDSSSDDDLEDQNAPSSSSDDDDSSDDDEKSPYNNRPKNMFNKTPAGKKKNDIITRHSESKNPLRSSLDSSTKKQ